MAKIATLPRETVWRCDNCETLASSPNAFTLPNGWWTAVIDRRTDKGHLKRGVIEACEKRCLTEAITFQNQGLIDFVRGKLNESANHRRP